MFSRFPIFDCSLIGYWQYSFQFMIYLLSQFSSIGNWKFYFRYYSRFRSQFPICNMSDLENWNCNFCPDLGNIFVCFIDSRFSIFRISETRNTTSFSTECLFLDLGLSISQIKTVNVFKFYILCCLFDLVHWSIQNLQSRFFWPL